MNDWPKAVAVAAVWIAMGFALGYGLFNMNVQGNTGTFTFMVVNINLVVGALLATIVIWRYEKPTNKPPENQ